MSKVSDLIKSIDYRIELALNKKKILVASYGKVIELPEGTNVAKVAIYGDNSNNLFSFPYRSYLTLQEGDDILILTTNGDYNTGRIIDKFDGGTNG